MSQINYSAIVIPKTTGNHLPYPSFKQVKFKSDSLDNAISHLKDENKIVSITDIDASILLQTTVYCESELALINLAKNILIHGFTPSEIERELLSAMLSNAARELYDNNHV
jgi:hypothetical protein